MHTNCLEFVRQRETGLDWPNAITPQDGTMQDQEEIKISTDMEEIIKNIDSIIDKINHQDPGRSEEMQQNEDLPA